MSSRLLPTKLKFQSPPTLYLTLLKCVLLGSTFLIGGASAQLKTPSLTCAKSFAAYPTNANGAPLTKQSVTIKPGQYVFTKKNDAQTYWHVIYGNKTYATYQSNVCSCTPKLKICANQNTSTPAKTTASTPVQTAAKKTNQPAAMAQVKNADNLQLLDNLKRKQANAAELTAVKTAQQGLAQAQRGVSVNPCPAVNASSATTSSAPPSSSSFVAAQKIESTCAINPAGDKNHLHLNAQDIDQAFNTCINQIFPGYAQETGVNSLKTTSEIQKKNSKGNYIKMADSNRYDYEISFWTAYWNKVFKTNPALPPELVKALIASESSCNVDAKAGDTGAGAMGLTQLMPETRIYLSGKCASTTTKQPYLEAICTNPPYRDLQPNQATISLEREDLTVNPVYRIQEWNNKTAAQKEELKKRYNISEGSSTVKLILKTENLDKAKYEQKIANRNICAGIRWLFRKLQLTKTNPKPCTSNCTPTQLAYDKWINVVMNYKCFTGKCAPEVYATGRRVQKELYDFSGQLTGKDKVIDPFAK